MENRKYRFGAIWQISDKEIKFPKNLFRTYHNSRLVVIIENSDLNFDKKEDFILIAPLSSVTLEHHNQDILIEPDDFNKIDKKSYIRMRAIQFIEKSSLKHYIGKTSNEIKSDILFTLNSYFNNGQVTND